MVVALKLALAYLGVLTTIFITVVGMLGSLLIQEWYYLVPTVLGTFLLIFVAHSPILKYIETTQRKIFDV